jgi:methyl-accepting chemotaxis protein
VGAPTDNTSAQTLFGQIRAAKSNALNAFDNTQTILNVLQGPEGLGIDDIRSLVSALQDSLEKLKENVKELFTKADADQLRKDIIDSLVKKVNDALDAMKLDIQHIKTLNEQQVKDMEAVRMKLKEIQKILELIKKAKEGEEVVVKSWFEVE